MEILVLIGYVILTVVVGFVFTSRPENNTESYFLSNRSLRWVTLFFTLIATNFSAFFFLGFAGEGYRVGYAYYPMMALGTSFAAISFFLIGDKAWKIGRDKKLLTPVEMIRSLSGHNGLSLVYLIIMCFFMIPFMAVQPIGAGLILENITQGAVPYTWGVIGMAVFILLYVYFGGLKSIIAMDVKNGILILTMMVLAIVVIVSNMGGLGAVNERLFAIRPELFAPEGQGHFFSPLKWLSFSLLWLTCLPMFPQIFTRFLIARDIESFKKSTFLYTLIPPFLFLIPVIIGVIGHDTFPDIVGKDSDRILPMMLSSHSPRLLAVIIMFGALAAFISTVDSILLALAMIGTRDVYMKYVRPDASEGDQVRIGRWIIAGLTLISVLIALYRPASIFAIVTMTFTGSSLLFPVTLAYFYMPRVKASWAMLGLIMGVVTLVICQFILMPKGLLGPLLPVVPCLAVVSAFTFIPAWLSPSGKTAL
jgi:SSS family solute:Na+ symporter